MASLASLPVHAQEWVSSLQLQAGFVPDPHTSEVKIGGPVKGPSLGSDCSGFFNPQAPALVFDYDNLDQTSRLGIFVNSPVNTTLAVVKPDGSVLCNNDSDYLANANPGVEIASAVSGQYRVMVGSLSDNTRTASESDKQAENSATLVITEYGPAMWMVLNLDSGFDSLLVNMINADIEFGDDSGDWANDGECDDPRFIGNGMAMLPAFDHERRDASDCRVLYGLGEVQLARPELQP